VQQSSHTSQTVVANTLRQARICAAAPPVLRNNSTPGERKKAGLVVDIARIASTNTNFRQVLYTTLRSQIVLMSLLPLEEIGSEIHAANDQFFRIEQGSGIVWINEVQHRVQAGSGILIPAGARHNIVNTSASESLKLVTIYSPPDHPDQTIHQTKAIAQSSNKPFDGSTTE